MAQPKVVVLVGGSEQSRAVFGPGVAAGIVTLTEASSLDEALHEGAINAPDLYVVAFEEAADSILTIRRLRQAAPSAKVIVLAATALEADALEGLREHAFAFLRSPWQLSDAREIIETALDLDDWEDGVEVVSGRADWVTLRLRCRRVTAERVLTFLDQLRVHLSAEERESTATAVREILLNAIEHGGQLDPEKWVTVSRIRTANSVIYRFEDPGEGFSQTNLPHAAISNPPDDPMAHAEKRAELGLRPGGFGLLVTRGLMDEVIFNEKGNEVLLIKSVAANPQD